MSPHMPDSSNIFPPQGELKIVGYAPTVLVYANFSEPWYRDALRESQGHDGEHSTRREIVFAASFLESYIFEWVRDLCLVRINEFFPPNARYKGDPLFRPTLKDKWKIVPLELHKEGIVAVAPALSLAPLGELMKLRNGSIHARASRPYAPGLPAEAQPVPAIDELKAIRHGWALSVARDLVCELHANLGTNAPPYL